MKAYAPSTEIERKAEEAMRNRERLAAYYRKRIAIHAARGISTIIPARHRHVLPFSGR